jgi:hypothetical protein
VLARVILVVTLHIEDVATAVICQFLRLRETLA